MMQARRRAVAAAAGLAIGLGLASVALAWLTGGLTGSFLGPDESAHYVNTLFIADWLRAGLPAPMAFARDFYVHYPKLSIGHWPPGWYALLAPAAKHHEFPRTHHRTERPTVRPPVHEPRGSGSDTTLPTAHW